MNKCRGDEVEICSRTSVTSKSIGGKREHVR